MTRRCTAACASCCFSCSPSETARLPLPLMLDYVAQAKRAASFRTISISGGEPFLQYPDVLAVARAARAAGLACSVVTNGYWATTISGTRERLRELRAAGVTQVRVSADCFHAEFVPLVRLRRLLRAARAETFPLTLNATSTRTRRGLRLLVDRLGDDLHEVMLIESACLPAGRARTTVPAADLFTQAQLPPQPCRERMCISILPDGRAYACTSVMGTIDPLKLGEVPRDSLAALVGNFWQDPVRRILSAHGPTWFLDRHRERKLPVAPGRRFAAACHACAAVLGASANVAALQPAIAAYVRAEALQALTGGMAAAGAGGKNAGARKARHGGKQKARQQVAGGLMH